MGNYNHLFHKYDKPVPRYTSYPSYPYWDKNFYFEHFEHLIYNNIDIKTNKNISIYVHLPYCENLCHFCGCNKIITKNHELEIPYLNSILKEWNNYIKRLPQNIIVKELHLGGGTPTFFSPNNLNYFLENLYASIQISPNHDFSIEAHPGVTTKEHLDVLSKHGFNRLSLGVQDFNDDVKKAIGRNQTFNDVKFCMNYAREVGFKSTNFDLIYGLPYQTLKTIEETFLIVANLKPDRIAFYSYAHLPSLKPSQVKLDLQKRPIGQEKYSIYSKACEILTKNEYVDMGYDHFCLKSDSMYEAFLNGNLHRNFMGYTVQNTPILIGLGVSAISDYDGFYVQNKKSLQEYMRNIANDIFQFEAGFVMTDLDKKIKKHILNLSCYRKTSFLNPVLPQEIEEKIITKLDPLISDGLVQNNHSEVEVLNSGIPFLRNICACFDMYFNNNELKSSHSQSV